MSITKQVYLTTITKVVLEARMVTITCNSHDEESHLIELKFDLDNASSFAGVLYRAYETLHLYKPKRDKGGQPVSVTRY